MRDYTETDYCDRLPGQHTGRLSLELQASEAAEWQMRLEQMEKETQRLRHWIARHEAKIRELTASPISPEVPQAELERCEFCNALERSRDGQNVTFWCGTITQGNRGSKLSDACRARQREVCCDETTPATPSAAVGASEPGAGDDPLQLEYGKRYLRADGNVSDPMERTAPESQKGITHPFRCPKYDVTYDEDGSHVAGEQCPCNLVAEYHEPSQPAESPDDWVMITDPDHIARKVDECCCEKLNIGWEPCHGLIGDRVGDCPNWKFRCRRKDQPAESPDDWVMQDRVPARPGIDRCWLSLPGDEPSDNMALWWDSDCDENAVGKMHGDASGNPGWVLNVRCRRKDLPVVPADKPKTRTVTLREYRLPGDTAYEWTTSKAVLDMTTGRTSVVEVPE